MADTAFDKDEFERQWDARMEEERQFARDFLQGKFADDLQGEDARGEHLDHLLGDRDAQSVIHGELERLCTAVIAWMAARDLGNALRFVKGDCYLATRNVGFEFESDFFRIASYDWSDDEDEDGNPIVRHNFVCKPSGTYLDWYKWAGRDDWASKGLAEAFVTAEERNIPIYAWWERIIDACIESLMTTEDATFHRIESCGWRHLDEDAIPHRMVRIDATIESHEVDSITLRHPEEGYVGFKMDAEPEMPLPDDMEDVTDGHSALCSRIADAVATTNRESPLDQSVSLDKTDCPDDIGYIVVGGVIFRRLVVNAPRWRIPTDEEIASLGDDEMD